MSLLASSSDDSDEAEDADNVDMCDFFEEGDQHTLYDPDTIRAQIDNLTAMLQNVRGSQARGSRAKRKRADTTSVLESMSMEEAETLILQLESFVPLHAGGVGLLDLD